MQIHCKKFIKHTENTFPKKMVPFSYNTIKEKYKRVICLTESTFIHEIEDRYDRKK